MAALYLNALRRRHGERYFRISDLCMPLATRIVEEQLCLRSCVPQINEEISDCEELHCSTVRLTDDARFPERRLISFLAD